MQHVSRAGSIAVALSVVLAACAADPPDTYDSTGAGTSPSVTAPALVASASENPATDLPTTELPTTEAPATVPGPPPGIVSASPFQYRLDR